MTTTTTKVARDVFILPMLDRAVKRCQGGFGLSYFITNESSMLCCHRLGWTFFVCRSTTKGCRPKTTTTTAWIHTVIITRRQSHSNKSPDAVLTPHNTILVFTTTRSAQISPTKHLLGECNFWFLLCFLSAHGWRVFVCLVVGWQKSKRGKVVRPVKLEGRLVVGPVLVWGWRGWEVCQKDCERVDCWGELCCGCLTRQYCFTSMKRIMMWKKTAGDRRSLSALFRLRSSVLFLCSVENLWYFRSNLLKRGVRETLWSTSSF